MQYSRTIKKLLIRFMEHPTKQEAQIWGAVPYEGIPIVGGYSTIASPIPLSTKALWGIATIWPSTESKIFFLEFGFTQTDSTHCQSTHRHPHAAS